MRLYLSQYVQTGKYIELYPILSISNPSRKQTEDQSLLYTRSTFKYNNFFVKDTIQKTFIETNQSIQNLISSEMGFYGLNIHFVQHTTGDIGEQLQQLKIDTQQIVGFGLLSDSLKALTEWETGLQRKGISTIDNIKFTKPNFTLDKYEMPEIQLKSIKEFTLDLYGLEGNLYDMKQFLESMCKQITQNLECLMISLYNTEIESEVYEEFFKIFEEKYFSFMKNLQTLEIHFCQCYQICDIERVFNFFLKLASGGNLKRLNLNLGLSGLGETFKLNDHSLETLKHVFQINPNIIHFLIHLPNNSQFQNTEYLTKFGGFLETDFMLFEKNIRFLSIDVWNYTTCKEDHITFIQQLSSYFSKREREFESLNLNFENWKVSQFDVSQSLMELLSNIKGTRHFYLNIRLLQMDEYQLSEIFQQIKRMNSLLLLHSFVIQTTKAIITQFYQITKLFEQINKSLIRTVQMFKALAQSHLTKQFRIDIIKDVLKVCCKFTEEDIKPIQSPSNNVSKELEPSPYQITSFF